MELFKWINSSLPALVEKLNHNIKTSYHIDAEENLSLSGRTEIYDILDKLLSVLFPGAYSRERVESKNLSFFLDDSLRHAAFNLLKHVREVLRFYCGDKCCSSCSCEERANGAVIGLMEALPEIRQALIADIRVAFEGDPAATSFDEIVFSYPCIEAIATYRIAHSLYTFDVPIIPRIMTERAHSHTGIDIHPGAEIMPGFFIDHGTGVVIGETCRIGSNVKLYQGVTLGALSPFDREGKPRKGEKRHPDLEDDVIIYANATILGGKTVIGKGAIIGGNTWIIKSVPPGAVIYNQ